jgi:hypothetical protein
MAKTPLYPTDKAPYFYIDAGEHDFLDTIIYDLACKQGLDTVILQHEIGETRSVTEILDVRRDSLNHLFKLPHELVPEINIPYYEDEQLFQETSRYHSKYATTWFSDDGFLTWNDSIFLWTPSTT